LTFVLVQFRFTFNEDPENVIVSVNELDETAFSFYLLMRGMSFKKHLPATYFPDNPH